MGLFQSQKQVTVDDLIDRYAVVLERGPSGSGTLYDLSRLPAEKPLMKAALIAHAQRLGSSAVETLRAAFVSLANFQSDLSEQASRHSEIAAEMTILRMEFDARTKNLRDTSDA